MRVEQSAFSPLSMQVALSLRERKANDHLAKENVSPSFRLPLAESLCKNVARRSAS